MLDKPQILQSKAQKTAVIRLTIPREEIQQVMGPAITEVFSTLAAQKIQPAGPWFSYHLRMDPKVFDFEVGAPVEKDVAPAGRVKPGALPAARVARTVYQGPYEGLGAAWGEFDAWIKAEKLEAAESVWEFYVQGPESGADPSKWRTELNRPLLG